MHSVICDTKLLVEMPLFSNTITPLEALQAGHLQKETISH